MSNPQENTYQRTDGATPNGGTYSVIYYRDGQGNPCAEAQAKTCEIVEYDAADNPIHRIYGLMNLKETNRYFRLAAERLARSMGYNTRRLRKGKARNGSIIYQIRGAAEAIVVDEAGNAKVCSVNQNEGL